jgi:hypothetical protein
MTQTASTFVPQAAEALFTALQSYPDFVDGLKMGKQSYYDLFEGMMSTEEISEEVHETLSHHNIHTFIADLHNHNESIDQPELFLLGLTLGELNESFSQPS